MKKALIIGVCGFVGDYLVKQLEKNYQVFGTKLKNEVWNNKVVPVFDIDILDKDNIETVLTKLRPDHIYHLAAQSSVALSWKNPLLTIDVNIIGSLNLMEAVRNLDYSPRILMIGSGEEYGYIKENELPIKEENPLRPGNIYAATKASQNMNANIYSKAYGLDVLMARAFNHIGPKQSDVFVVSDFCKQVAMIEAGYSDPIIYVGNILVKRDFTDVRDVVNAYELLMLYGEKSETYNIGSGKSVAIEEILKIILSLSEIKIDISPLRDKIRPSDVPIIVADCTKIKEKTGWIPKIELEKSIKDTLDYWRKNIIRERRI